MYVLYVCSAVLPYCTTIGMHMYVCMYTPTRFKNVYIDIWCMYVWQGFALALCLLLALIGVFAFYPYIQGDVLNNFPSDSVPISVARVLLAVTMVLTYPVRCAILSVFINITYIHTSSSNAVINTIFIIFQNNLVVCYCWRF